MSQWPVYHDKWRTKHTHTAAQTVVTGLPQSEPYSHPSQVPEGARTRVKRAALRGAELARPALKHKDFTVHEKCSYALRHI